ncbi:MAG: AraC family transcriptional regulator, partial [Bacteroidota bacterium]
MSKTVEINSIAQANHALGLPKPKHPLVSVVRTKDFRSLTSFKDVKVVVNLYQVIFKEKGCGTVYYGKNSYDYEEGTLIFTAPGQVTEYLGDEEEDYADAEDWTLAFHPDLIRKSDLGKHMSSYTFFDYDISEALHLAEEEKGTIEDSSI